MRHTKADDDERQDPDVATKDRHIEYRFSLEDFEATSIYLCLATGVPDCAQLPPYDARGGAFVKESYKLFSCSEAFSLSGNSASELIVS